MEPYPMDEVIELEESRSILLSFDRVWPKYVVTWSVRQQVGESDFPIAGGTVGALPPAEGTIDDLWERLRAEATRAAQRAIPALETQERRGFFSRLFNRN